METSTGTSFLGGLAKNEFTSRDEPVMVSCIFAENKNVAEIAKYQLRTMQEYVGTTQ